MAVETPTKIALNLSARELRWIVTAAGTDRTRPHLANVFVDIDTEGKLIAFATDSYRMHFKSFEEPAPEGFEPFAVGSEVLAKMLGPNPKQAAWATFMDDGVRTADWSLPGSRDVTIPTWREMLKTQEADAPMLEFYSGPAEMSMFEMIASVRKQTGAVLTLEASGDSVRTLIGAHKTKNGFAAANAHFISQALRGAAGTTARVAKPDKPWRSALWFDLNQGRGALVMPVVAPDK